MTRTLPVLGRVQRTKKVLEKQSSEVSAMRKEAAERLTAAVTQALLDLNFLDVRFTMNFERMAEYTANGFDDAEFLISTNPGEPLKPLGKSSVGRRTFAYHACHQDGVSG